MISSQPTINLTSDSKDFFLEKHLKLYESRQHIIAVMHCVCHNYQ